MSVRVPFVYVLNVPPQVHRVVLLSFRSLSSRRHVVVVVQVVKTYIGSLTSKKMIGMKVHVVSELVLRDCRNNRFLLTRPFELVDIWMKQKLCRYFTFLNVRCNLRGTYFQVQRLLTSRVRLTLKDFSDRYASCRCATTLSIGKRLRKLLLDLTRSSSLCKQIPIWKLVFLWLCGERTWWNLNPNKPYGARNVASTKTTRIF